MSRCYHFRVIWRIGLVLIFIFTGIALPAYSQTLPDMYCYNGYAKNAERSLKLPNGHTVRIWPLANGDAACGAEVFDPSGKSVFRSTGFGTTLHEWSGHDVDNDGRADAVIGTDTGGGNRCCWEYAVFSFSPAPRVIARLEPSRFDTDAMGRTRIWVTHPLYDVGSDMASSPVVLTVEQFRGGKLADITMEYCEELLTGDATSADRDRLSEEFLQASRTSEKPDTEVLETRRAAMSVLLQNLVCERVTAADTLVKRAWPVKEQSRIRTLARTSIEPLRPLLSRRLAAWK